MAPCPCVIDVQIHKKFPEWKADFVMAGNRQVTNTIPSQVCAVWLYLYPVLQSHLYDPGVLMHRPFSHRETSSSHSSTSEI